MSSPRRRSREFALQGLYQWQYTGASAAQVLKNLSEMDEFDQADREFLEAELGGTIAKAEGLRAHLEPLVDRKWGELSPIERAILSIAAYELANQPDVPYKVVINEAVELAKSYGGTDGFKYVNGVLDKLAVDARPLEIARK